MKALRREVLVFLGLNQLNLGEDLDSAVLLVEFARVDHHIVEHLLQQLEVHSDALAHEDALGQEVPLHFLLQLQLKLFFNDLQLEDHAKLLEEFDGLLQDLNLRLVLALADQR